MQCERYSEFVSVVHIAKIRTKLLNCVCMLAINYVLNLFSFMESVSCIHYHPHINLPDLSQTTIIFILIIWLLKKDPKWNNIGKLLLNLNYIKKKK